MTPDSHLTRRQLLRWSRAGVLACAGFSVVLPACDWDGNFTILGYSTAPNYDPKYKTVRVPVFANKTYRRGLEYDLTNAVITQIEEITHMKVVTGQADTELIGTLTMTTKGILSVNQINEVREGEVSITIELVWRDLHTGAILTRPGPRPLDPSPFDALAQAGPDFNTPGLRTPVPITPPMPPNTTGPNAPLEPIEPSPPEASDPAFRLQPNVLAPPAVTTSQPRPPGTAPAVIPLKITTTGDYIPELGPSTATAYQTAIHRLAVQIVSAMEKPW